MVVVNDLLEGLKIAISRGNSMQEAMQSFYNAGYKKEDVEQAARYFQGMNPQVGIQQQTQSTPQNTNIQPAPQNPPQQSAPSQPRQVVSNYSSDNPQQIQAPKQSIQTVSNYSQKSENPQNTLIIILVILLVILGTAIAGIFFFKDAIVQYLNGVVG